MLNSMERGSCWFEAGVLPEEETLISMEDLEEGRSLVGSSMKLLPSPSASVINSLMIS